MSVDINWETLTAGPDGVLLAEAIRAFIHDRFQKVALPRMIRSVQVHSFDFGTIPPKVELKDVCDPLPDFYDDEGDDQDEPLGQSPDNDRSSNNEGLNDNHPIEATAIHDRTSDTGAKMPPPPFGLRTEQSYSNRPGSSVLPRATPGILGGTSNLGYFHLPLSAGLSGTSTPLAAVAGAQFQNTWPEASTYSSTVSGHQRATSFGSVTPPSVTTPTSRPTSRHQQEWSQSQMERSMDGADGNQSPSFSAQTAEREKSTEDLQVVSHISYSGDIRLSLTAEILLDYPMPSFVGIPLKLNVTGLTFDGVALLAYIKKKCHFCFLCPEDADALVGGDVDLGMSDAPDDDGGPPGQRAKVGGIFEEIKVESEIGQKESGKQVLKNVGKVEKFVLEQVRRIFEDEFVYPSFWTFLF